MAEEVSNREGCYLYDIEFVGGQTGRVLRVTIDKAGEGGVSIDDCSNVSRGLNLLLDVEDVIPGGAYSLEVSSPGLERALKEPRHYVMAVGRQVLVRTFQPLLQFNPEIPELGKAKQVQGQLLAVVADESVNPSVVSHANEGVVENASASEAAVLPAVPAVLKGLKVEFQGKDVFIPMESVTKAHVVFEFVNPSENKPGKGPKKGKAKA